MAYGITALLVASVGPTIEAQIKLGGLIHGDIGSRGKAAVEAWVAEVTKNGAYVGFTAEAKFVEYARQNVSANLAELMDFGMNVLMTPYGSGDTIATLNAVPVNTDMPILIWGGASDSIFAADGPCKVRNLNCFGGLTTASRYMLPSLEAMVEHFGPLSVFILTNNDGFSEAVTSGAKPFIETHDELSLAGEESISVRNAILTDDDMSRIELAIAAKPDVFMLSGHAGDVEQVIGLIKAGFTETYAPKAILATNGLTTPSNYDPATGIEGVIMPDQWFDTSPMADSIIQWTSADFKAAMEDAGQTASYHAASAGALVVMLAHGMVWCAAAMGGDGVQFNAASLAGYMYALPPTDTFYGTIDWHDDGSLASLKPMYGKQHQVASVEIIAPAEMATAELIDIPTPPPKKETRKEKKSSKRGKSTKKATAELIDSTTSPAKKEARKGKKSSKRGKSTKKSGRAGKTKTSRKRKR